MESAVFKGSVSLLYSSAFLHGAGQKNEMGGSETYIKDRQKALPET